MIQTTTEPWTQEAASIRAVPAQSLPCGFRLLVMRQLHKENEPPLFAWIEQRLLRTPQRLSRHGLHFGVAFLPEIMASLSEQLGRPSLHTSAGEAYRNPKWPFTAWRSEDRSWPDGVRTIEWFVDVVFQDEASCGAFRERWRGRLNGEIEEV